MPSWGSPNWETAMDSWHCLFSMHLMMGIKYGNSWNRPTPAGATHDAYPIIFLRSLTRLALPVNTITRECGSLTRPCVSLMVTADVTKGRTEIFKFDAQHIIWGRAVPYTTRLVLLAEDFGRPYLLHNDLTHWGRVTHICISKLTIIGSDNDLLPCWCQSHYLNQCWNIVNWTLQWNLN